MKPRGLTTAVSCPSFSLDSLPTRYARHFDLLAEESAVLAA